MSSQHFQKCLCAGVILLAGGGLEARQGVLSCGSNALRSRQETQLHRASRRVGIRALRAGSREASPTEVRPDAGDIAIVDDTGGVVARRNSFNLNRRTLRFLPEAGAERYRFELGGDTFDSAGASDGAPLTGLGDDDSRPVQLSFKFPFFGRSFSTAYVNSDGNLTFEEPDDTSSDRSLGRMTGGAPRIAALFRDLNPSQGDASVRVSASDARMVITWSRVPEYTDNGPIRPQTFQLRLFPDGIIEFAWAEISSEDAVVGISPGRSIGTPSVLSFLTDSSGTYSSTVAERFSGTELVDIFTAAQQFYRSHEDAYDYLVIFNSLGIPADTDAVAYEVTVRNSGSGFSVEKFDHGLEAGSPRRLQAVLNMGPLSQYPANPNSLVPGRASVGDTSLSVLAHETGHLFLAYTSVRDGNATPMLGYQSAHWAFTFNSEASLLEGNRIADYGPDANPRFATVATVEGYSPLDQYLMGFRAPEEVPDTFYVANARGSQTAGLPRVGVNLNGERRNVTIDDIISVAGRRSPDYTIAQRRFRFGFILVGAADSEPSSADLDRLQAWRTAFETYFSKASSNRAVADTSLKRALQVSGWPGLQATAGSTTPVTVSVNEAADMDLTFVLRSDRGRDPRTIVIPAGNRSVSFEVQALGEGTEELVIEPANSRYETVSLRIAVVN